MLDNNHVQHINMDMNLFVIANSGLVMYFSIFSTVLLLAVSIFEMITRIRIGQAVD